MAKYKMTPLARFFLFMVIAAPLLFLLATYMTGEKKYLNQVIEWVNPSEIEEVAAPTLDTSASTEPNSSPDSSSSSNSNRVMDTLSNKVDSVPQTEKTISLRDSLNLLKEQLADCKNN